MKQVSILILALLFITSATAFVPPLEVPPPGIGGSEDTQQQTEQEEQVPSQQPLTTPPSTTQQPTQTTTPPTTTTTQRTRNPWMLAIAIALLAIGAGGAVAYYFLHQKKRLPQLDPKRVEAAKAYATQLRMQGIDERLIAEQLLSSGWPKDYVDQITKP